MNTCRHCNKGFEARTWQIKKGDYECDTCRKSRQAKYRATRKESGNPVVSGRMPLSYHQAYGVAYYARTDIREKRAKAAKARLNDPNHAERIKARYAIRNALRRGEIKKGVCEVCAERKVEAHHDDYSKPLIVRWLCKAHHVAHHKATGAQS